ncbi:MAG: hypothetical protein L6244_01425 [Candidatus Methanoperedenaceae archaeon]|nr:hypothetical protein [Candidatus Methanoperedenaceae archaeon]
MLAAINKARQATRRDSAQFVSAVWKILLFIICLATSAIVLNHHAYSRVVVDIQFSLETEGRLAVYWAAQNQQFSNRRLIVRSCPAGKQSASFTLPPLEKRKVRLRIDSVDGTGAIELSGIKISRLGFIDSQLKFPDDKDKLQLSGVGQLELGSNGIRATGKAPHFMLSSRLEKTAFGEVLSLILIVVVAVLLWLLCWSAGCVDGKGRVTLFCGLTAGILVLFAMSEAPFESVLVKDAYTYIEKAVEITEGNWALPHRKAIGWPMLQAAFYIVLDVRDYFSAMTVSRLLGIALIAISAIPVYMLGRHLGGTIAGALAAIFMVTHTKFIFSSYLGYAEPLYMVVMYGGLYMLFKSEGRGVALWVGVAMTALAFLTRPQGLFVIPFLFLFALLIATNWQDRLKLAAGTISVFVLLSAPHLIARMVQYGSPLDYGDNSKYLVDAYRYVYAPNIQSPSFIEFWQQRGLEGVYQKFIVNGLFSLTEQYFRGIGWLSFVLLIVTSIGSFFIKQLKQLRPLVAYCAVFFFPLVLVWDVYHSSRFFYSIMPASIIIAATGGIYLLRRLGLGAGIYLISAAILLMLVTTGNHKADLFFIERVVKQPNPPPAWAMWGGENVYGRVAINEYLNILEMSAGERSRNIEKRKYMGDKEWVEAFRPGIYSNIDEALVQWRRNDVKFVVSDTAHNKIRPYFNEIRNRVGRDFQLLKEFQYPFEGGRRPPRVVSFYKILYSSESADSL